VVEQAIWIEEGYKGDSRVVQIPVSTFDPNCISFTYLNSMISYWLRSQADQVFYHPAYHGQVFRLSEIYKIIDEFGIPGEEWRSEEIRRYNLFIEAQVWISI
jgi:hypothetical protein